MAAKKKAGKKKEKEIRTILVILRNRFDPFQKPIYLEVKADDQGTILEQKRLRAEPKEPRFDEVWENDEGRKDLDSCTRIKRIYRHRLERPRQ